MDGVWLLVSGGMEEKDVLDLPLDKFFMYQESEKRKQENLRKLLVMDTAGAIGGALSKDGVTKYLKHIEGE